MPDAMPCRKCDGGKKEIWATQVCVACNGTGKNLIDRFSDLCRSCNGSGIKAGTIQCNRCNGTGKDPYPNDPYP